MYTQLKISFDLTLNTIQGFLEAYQRWKITKLIGEDDEQYRPKVRERFGIFSGFMGSPRRGMMVVEDGCLLWKALGRVEIEGARGRESYGRGREIEIE